MYLPNDTYAMMVVERVVKYITKEIESNILLIYNFFIIAPLEAGWNGSALQVKLVVSFQGRINGSHTKKVRFF
jgi:hypothetical protein